MSDFPQIVARLLFLGGFTIKYSHMSRKKHPITSWSEDDRPREKLLNKGSEALSNGELIAILLGSGNQEMSAVELADELLSDADYRLNDLARFSVHDLMQYKGIGEAKAVSVMAAMEIGRRRLLEKSKIQSKITCSMDMYQYLSPRLADLNHEEFHVILLNQANRVIRTLKVSSGGVAGTVVDQRLIFKSAIQNLASSVILAHNHPSGSLHPSEQDKVITTKIVESCKILDLRLLDHLIITQDDYYSFADEGMI